MSTGIYQEAAVGKRGRIDNVKGSGRNDKNLILILVEPSKRYELPHGLQAMQQGQPVFPSDGPQPMERRAWDAWAASFHGTDREQQLEAKFTKSLQSPEQTYPRYEIDH